MQAAWEALRKPDWPDLAELARHALHYSLVRGTALRRSCRESTPAPPPPQQQQQPQRMLGVPLPHHAPVFDHKRAAAGERDDD